MIDEKTLKIVKSLTVMAVAQVEGVLYFAEDSIEGQEISRRSEKGVSVEVVRDKVVIDITVSILNGYSIPDLCCDIQQRVIQEVEKALPVKVSTVNVNIDGIIFKR